MQTLKNNFPPFLAIWNPTVLQTDKNGSPSFRIDHPTLALRVAAVSAITFFLLSQTFAVGAAYFFLPEMTVVLILSYTLVTFEKWRATKALNHRAVDLFKSENPVSIKTMSYLSTHPAAIQTLIKDNADFTKKDKNKHSLLYHVMIEKSSRSHMTESRRIDSFQRLVINEKIVKIDLKSLFLEQGLTPSKLNPKMIKTAFDKGYLTPSMFNEEETSICWRFVKDEEIAQSMKDKGFNIEAKTDQASALCRSIASQNIPQVKLLIKMGAKIPPFIYTSDGKTELQTFLQDKPELKEALS